MTLYRFPVALVNFRDHTHSAIGDRPVGMGVPAGIDSGDLRSRPQVVGFVDV